MTTKPLLTRAEALLNRLVQVREQEQDIELRATVERVQSRARRAWDVLAEVVQAAPALKERGVRLPVVPNPPSIDVAKAKSTLRKTAESIVGTELSTTVERIKVQSVNQALEAGEKIARTVVVDLNGAVDARRVELLPHGIDRPVVSYPGVEDSLVVGLRNVQRSLRFKVESLRVRDLVPHLDGVLRDVERWERERPRLDAALADHHPEVKEFLRRAATDEGAPWHLITPQVQQWLADPAHTALLKVVLRA